MEAGVDWNRVEGNWKQVTGKIKEKWGKLTDDDLANINGKREQLEGKIQERYGIARDQVRKDVDTWYTALKWWAKRIAPRTAPVEQNSARSFCSSTARQAFVDALVTAGGEVIGEGNLDEQIRFEVNAATLWQEGEPMEISEEFRKNARSA
jgi:uncharacterized protein YjbJ (UPF0337 family)